MTMVPLCHKAVRALGRLLPLCVLLFFGAVSLWGQTPLSQYVYMAGSGSQIDLTAPSTIFGNNFDDGVSGPYNIGFTFNFCGTAYTQFSASSNGYIGLGSTNASSILSGTFGSTNPGVPVIAAFWRDLYTASGDVLYQTVGNSPNRILVVQWRVNACCAGGAPGSTMQVRLFEGSNKIELWYGGMNVSCGQIGAQFSLTNYASITAPAGTISYSSGNGCSSAPSSGALYTLSPCVITVTGNVAQGATASMNDGDSVFKAVTIQRGNSATYQPFTVTGPGCSATALTFTLTGAAAADYQITPASTTVSSSASVTPTVTFTPKGLGLRAATLTITAPSFMRTYYLVAKASPRITWTGNVAQGGTATVTDGDTLLRSVSIPRRSSINVTPITLTNTNNNAAAPPAVITYSIRGTSGQYTVSPASASITGGQTSTPVITFNATGIGVVIDTLTVVADGETRIYQLRAFSEAPGGTFSIGAERLDTNTSLFRNRFGCIGEETVTYEVDAVNIGYGPFTINSVEFYRIDTTYKQGTPKYPLLRDEHGALIPSYDYVVTDKPPVYPISANNQTWPISIDAGTTRKIYVTFVAQDRDKRFVRAYFRTNAQNFIYNDTNGVEREGLLHMEFYARGVGARLSDNPGGSLPKGVSFPTTRINESVDISVPLFNPGECPLRISLDDVVLVAGDIDEFSVVKLPSSVVDPATNDLLLAPGASDSLVLRFSPRQVGSRRASLRLFTNDSTMVVPKITEKGIYYIDLYGSGKADLYANDADFGVALMGGTGADQPTRPIRVVNTLNGPIRITQILIEGTDAAEFIQDGAHPWPQLPMELVGGQMKEFSIAFAPATGGQPGPRTAVVKVATADGDTIVARLSGVAGTRTIAVNPTAMNFGPVAAGKLLRRQIMILNTGTMPLTISGVALSPGSDFMIGMLPRTVLAPGQTEYLELTYAPQSSGASSAILTVGSNATGGAVQVQLTGSATKTKLGDPDPSSLTIGRNDGPVFDGVVTPGESLNASGVTSEELASGLRLLQSVPNPARDQVEIRYMLATGGDVRLELYDAGGRLVKVLDAGHRLSGETRVVVDVGELASGTYHYRLSAGSSTVSRTMTIAR